MTRLPAEAFKIEPLKGEGYPPYTVGPICALQTCSRLADHAHHIVRRSFTIGPYDWVKIDGTIVGNLMPLCWRHHQEVTEDRSRIVWDERRKVFFWETPGRDGDLNLAQPPKLEATIEGHASSVDVPHSNGHVPDGRCPTCHRSLPRERIERDREDKRPRKTWSITVPNDAREIGADVLDTLLESARLILDDHGIQYGHERGVRYFVLSTTLGLFVAHAEEVLGDGSPGAPGREAAAQA